MQTQADGLTRDISGRGNLAPTGGWV